MRRVVDETNDAETRPRHPSLETKDVGVTVLVGSTVTDTAPEL